MNCLGDGADGPPLAQTTVSGDSPTLAVVRAVAAVENEEPESLTPLADVVDPEALEAMVEGSGGPVRVSFGYAGHRVVVRSETVEIY